MREQIRLWFYSQSFMSVTLTGRSPYLSVLTYEKLLDENGREMHRSWGNAIDAAEALDNMGADVMRLLFCAQVPSQNIRFGYGPAREIKRRLLTLWNSVSFFVTYANIEGYRPSYADLEAGPQTEELRTLDRWLVARTQQLVEETTTAYESFWTPGVTRAFDAFVDDLSNWYIRRSRRRFYEYDDAAFRTLWYALVQALRVIAPVMPFLAEQLWRNLVVEPCEDAPQSVFLASWPETGSSRTVCSKRSRPHAAWSSSAVKHDPRQGSSIASRCGGSSCKARRSPTRTWSRSRRSCASRPSSSATSTRPSCS